VRITHVGELLHHIPDCFLIRAYGILSHAAAYEDEKSKDPRNRLMHIAYCFGKLIHESYHYPWRTHSTLACRVGTRAELTPYFQFRVRFIDPAL